MEKHNRKYDTDYDIMILQAEALMEGVPFLTANLANISALIYGGLEDINWAGFYFRNGDELVLGPFQGKPACVRIQWGKGVCGTAAAEDCTQLVYNVHEFAGHIACDSASNSEIVVPLHDREGKVAAVLDIDSPLIGRFTEEDRAGLEDLAQTLEKHLTF